METTHIAIIVLAALSSACIAMLLRACWLVRRGRRALLQSIGTEKEYIRREIRLEREKKELEEKLSSLLPADPVPKAKKSKTTNK